METQAKPIPNAEIKIKKNRSTAYPSISLDEAIAYTQKIKAAYGSSSFNRENGVQAMGFNKVTGTTAMKISALVHFGLFIREGNVYKLSELSDRILHPISEEDKHNAIIEACIHPKLFSQLIVKFGGKSLPGLLNNILIREYKINQNIADDLVDTFKKSLETAGIYENGVVAQGVALQNGDDTTNAKVRQVNADPTSVKMRPLQISSPVLPQGLQQILLSGGVILSYPVNLSYLFAIGKFGPQIQELNSAIEFEVKSIELKSSQDE
jgi:hypothetical protein